jgi:hypothetical protein
MAEGKGEQPDAAASVPAEPAPASQLSRPAGRVPAYEFDPDHQRRYAEATVRKLEIEAEQADNDREMRKASRNGFSTRSSGR